MANQVLSKSNNHNPNYLAAIAKVTNIREHPNANKLNLCTVAGNTIIVGKDVEEGDTGVYFPLECIINHKFLAFCNLYRDKKLNRDGEANPGFFEVKYDNNDKPIGGRVKAIKLRGILSEGFWIEVERLADYLHSISIGESSLVDKMKGLQLLVNKENYVGEVFDEVNGEWFVKKYIPRSNSVSANTGKQGKKAKVSLIIPDQFRFHYSTEQLARNLFQLNPNDLISITYKLHGTSGVFSKLLVKDMSLKGRIGRFLKMGGIKYDNIYSSRRVLKSGWLLPANSQHYYKEDIWGTASLVLDPFIEKGMTLYAEVVGFTSEGSPIQGEFDYGCNPGEFKIYIYRITHTNPDGKVYEMNPKQVQWWCKERGLNPVPELYYGYIYNLFSELDYTDERWRDNFLSLLREKYVEGKMCHMCKNEVPAEGVVLRIDDLAGTRAYKCKNSEFLLRESKELDQGIVSIEEAN